MKDDREGVTAGDEALSAVERSVVALCAAVVRLAMYGSRAASIAASVVRIGRGCLCWLSNSQRASRLITAARFAWTFVLPVNRQSLPYSIQYTVIQFVSLIRSFQAVAVYLLSHHSCSSLQGHITACHGGVRPALFQAC